MSEKGTEVTTLYAVPKVDLQKFAADVIVSVREQATTLPQDRWNCPYLITVTVERLSVEEAGDE